MVSDHEQHEAVCLKTLETIGTFGVGDQSIPEAMKDETSGEVASELQD